MGAQQPAGFMERKKPGGDLATRRDRGAECLNAGHSTDSVPTLGTRRFQKGTGESSEPCQGTERKALTTRGQVRVRRQFWPLESCR